jgi:hypothetical protein
MLDRGYDPHSPAYGYTTVDSLDQLNTLLGLGRSNAAPAA